MRSTRQLLLAGDVGGTKSLLGLFEERGERLELVRDAEYPSARFSSLTSIVDDFLRKDPGAAVRAVCFGIAGPVVAGRAKITNLPWVVDAQSFSDLVPGSRVALLNDLQATAVGTLHLDADDVCVLNEGTTPTVPANIAVIAAGTGLGEGFLFWDGMRYRPAASEGGHSDFAPRDAAECDLLEFLRGRFREHVSYERLLSGPGLALLYRFERSRSESPEPQWLTSRLASGDPAAVVAATALAGEDPACAAALARFVAIYGAEAGNLALKVLALGGVFVAGGIAPKILRELSKGGFMRAFAEKGRLAPLLSEIPVKVVLNSRAALIGAAYFARDL